MRLHEEPKEAQATNPAPARATAEEFAAAVAALEARNSESGRPEGASSTVDIAEAVRELGLEADPQDVWAEVQNQRARRVGAETQAARRPQTARKRRRLAGILAAVIAIPSGVLIGGAVIGAHLHHQGAVVAAAPWPLLSEIPDNVPVYAQATDIADLLNGKDPAQTLVSRIEGPHHQWVIIRHNGELYLRGYALPQVAQPGYLSRVSLYSEGAVGELTGALPGRHHPAGRRALERHARNGWLGRDHSHRRSDGRAFYDKW